MSKQEMQKQDVKSPFFQSEYYQGIINDIQQQKAQEENPFGQKPNMKEISSSYHNFSFHDNTEQNSFNNSNLFSHNQSLEFEGEDKTEQSSSYMEEKNESQLIFTNIQHDDSYFQDQIKQIQNQQIITILDNEKLFDLAQLQQEMYQKIDLEETQDVSDKHNVLPQKDQKEEISNQIDILDHAQPQNESSDYPNAKEMIEESSSEIDQKQGNTSVEKSESVIEEMQQIEESKQTSIHESLISNESVFSVDAFPKYEETKQQVTENDSKLLIFSSPSTCSPQESKSITIEFPSFAKYRKEQNILDLE